MAFSFPCPSCHKRLRADERSIGKRAKCKCGTVLTVPPAPEAVNPLNPVMTAPPGPALAFATDLSRAPAKTSHAGVKKSGERAFWIWIGSSVAAAMVIIAGLTWLGIHLGQGDGTVASSVQPGSQASAKQNQPREAAPEKPVTVVGTRLEKSGSARKTLPETP